MKTILKTIFLLLFVLGAHLVEVGVGERGVDVRGRLHRATRALGRRLGEAVRHELGDVLVLLETGHILVEIALLRADHEHLAAVELAGLDAFHGGLVVDTERAGLEVAAERAA